MQMQDKKYIIFTGLVLACLAAGGILTVAGQSREFSENENRYLTQFQKISGQGVLSGETQQNISDAMSDQFPARDFWTGLSTQVEKMLGYRDIGGVYLGKEHYYFEKVMNQDISQTNYFQNLRFVKYISERTEDTAETTALLVPSPGMVLRDKLPDNAVLYDGDMMFREAANVLSEDVFLDIREAMEKEAGHKQVYFRTDHHWTLRGAYVAYEAYCEKQGRPARGYEEFRIRALSDSFYGTLYSKVLDASAVPDELDTIQELPEVRVVCDGEERSTIYDEEKLLQKDKYAYYFGGNYGRVTIQNDAAPDRKLLVLKDSFANTMIPFLIADYQEIDMLDLRYFRGSMEEYLKEYEADEILILFEMSNFAQESNLTKLMQ